MAVEEIAELGVDLADAEGGGEVVGLQLVLEAALELEQGGILDVEQSESAEVAVAQGVADFARLACVEDTGYAVGGSTRERKRSTVGPLRSPRR